MPATSALTAEEIIARLGLEPHPEGGFFRQTLQDAPAGGGRAVSTAIYFLLPRGVVSRWHRIDATEVWHYYAGASLRLWIAAADTEPTCVTLGPALHRGEHPQAIVPVRAWQQAESTGAWTLAGCTVAPGFEFGGFEMAQVGFTPGRG